MVDDRDVKEMEAAARAYFAIDRARAGGLLRDNEAAEMIYMIGFGAGCDWALKKVKGEL